MGRGAKQFIDVRLIGIEQVRSRPRHAPRRLIAARVFPDCIRRDLKVAGDDFDLLAVALTTKANGLPDFQANHPC